MQTEIRVGNIAIPRKNDDFMALDLAAKILGGEGANRLHRVLRSERGLTYGASADFNALKQAGDIVAQTNTRIGDDGRDAAADGRRGLAAACATASATASSKARRTT